FPPRLDLGVSRKTEDAEKECLKMRTLILLCALLSVATSHVVPTQTQKFALNSTQGLKLRNVKAEPINYKGRNALRVTDEAPAGIGDEGRLAALTDTDFQDGTIEVDLTGAPLPNAGEGARGFVGLAFRVAPDASRFECIYLRPTNGRAEDQVRRNH